MQSLLYERPYRGRNRPFRRLIFPILGILVLNAFWVFKNSSFWVLSYLHISTLFLFVRTEPQVFTCVPTAGLDFQ